MGVLVLQHVDPFTDLLERPGGFGFAGLLCRLPGVPVALARGADAHQLLVGTVAAVAAITAGSHVVDRLKVEKDLLQNLVNADVKSSTSRQSRVCVALPGGAACGSVH